MSVNDLLTDSDGNRTWKNLYLNNLTVAGTLTAPSQTVYGYYTQNIATVYGSGSYTDVITNTTQASAGITKVSSNAYTMQYGGVYKIDIDMYAAGGTYPARVDFKLIKNGVDVSGSIAASTATGFANIHCSFLISLVAGDTIRVGLLATTNSLTVGSVSGNANSIIITKV